MSDVINIEFCNHNPSAKSVSVHNHIFRSRMTGKYLYILMHNVRLTANVYLIIHNIS